MKPTLFISLGISFSLFIGGCASEKKSTSPSEKHIDEKSMIVAGSGGGFSGLNEGVSVHRNGDVYTWRTMSGKPDSLHLAFHTTPDSVDFFFRYLDEMGFDNMNLHTSGNMNSFIEKTDGESNHRVQWSMESSNANPQLTTYYSLIRNYVQRKSSGK